MEEVRQYSVKIVRSSRELTAKERLQIRDIQSAMSIDEGTKQGQLIIKPEEYVVLDVHNEKAKGDKDYEQLVIVDDIGQKWYTGSPSFINSFFEIVEEMKEESESWSVSCFRALSKNYAGKEFLSCSVV